jgi:hypothetical protein
MAPRTSGTRIGPDRAPSCDQADRIRRRTRRRAEAPRGPSRGRGECRAAAHEIPRCVAEKAHEHHPLMLGPTPPACSIRYGDSFDWSMARSSPRTRLRRIRSSAVTRPWLAACIIKRTLSGARLPSDGALFAPGGYVLDLEGSRGLRTPLLRRRPSPRCRPRPAPTPKARA